MSEVSRVNDGGNNTDETVLTINSGSSSIKFSLYRSLQNLELLLSGSIERIGLAGTTLSMIDHRRLNSSKENFNAVGIEEAARGLVSWLENQGLTNGVSYVGHRVVHGGPRHYKAERITDDLIQYLEEISPLDPDHLPGEIALIRVLVRELPRACQVACFDTGFHHEMPRVAQLLPLPHRYYDEGMRRYGFHGLSYAYILEELRRVAGEKAASGRLVLAHLGSGASMAAVYQGKSQDTTMGFTPTAGLVMGTRSGDLDPGVLVYLIRKEGLDDSALNELINHKAGLVGVSGISPDMRDLQEMEKNNPNARDAIDLFCYQAAKYIAAMAVSMNGIDTLVFSGGIGERSPAVRERICQRLGFMGIRVDAHLNRTNEAIISSENNPVTVRVIKTNEELMIARMTLAVGRSKNTNL